MDTYSDDLAALFETLDLKNAIMVGHSTGGGEVAHYLGRHGAKRSSWVLNDLRSRECGVRSVRPPQEELHGQGGSSVDLKRALFDDDVLSGFPYRSRKPNSGRALLVTLERMVLPVKIVWATHAAS